MQQNNNTKWFSPISYAVVLVIGVALGVFFKGNNSFNVLPWQNQHAIEEIMQLVKSKYVDSITNDSADLKIADYYLAQLDPHSLYIPPADLGEVNEQLMSNFKGIGIEFQQFRDSVFVSYVLKAGPAEKAGLLVGDILLKADDSIQLSGKKWDGEDIRKKLKGPSNSKVALLVKRGSINKLIVVERDNVLVSSIDAAYMIQPTQGYIRINKFADRTYESFMQALEPLLKDSMHSLIIDLRGNGGGLLSEAVAIADELIAGNKLIVYTQGAHSPRVDFYSKREGLFEEVTLTVLMDETSASASEVLAGALQDWDRATIVGRRSFGKGLVQQQFNLSNGGALRLTTAKYYTPLGRDIQRPYTNGKLAYEKDFVHRVYEDALGKQDTTFKGIAYKTPKGHIVYGGGGIYPDTWVFNNDIMFDSNYSVLFAENLLNDFVFKWFMKEQATINKLKTPTDFITAYKGKNVWDELLQFSTQAQKQKLKKLEKNKAPIQRQILSLAARMKWYKQGYYVVQNTLDPDFISMLPKL
jgi:carboxyl-terminal processing protease